MVQGPQQLCWATTCRRISLDLFAHTLDLDLKFHLLRKTGEVTRIMDRGTNALQNILSTVIFNIGAPVTISCCVHSLPNGFALFT